VSDAGGEALVALVERALGGAVFAPGLAARGAAGVVAIEQPADDVGEQLALGVFGFGVQFRLG
jgi:hypothetical protein